MIGRIVEKQFLDSIGNFLFDSTVHQEKLSFSVDNFLILVLQCRGWGTDLVPPHMSDLYHKQMELHEAAARRESLSALSLAISSGPAGSSAR